MDPRGPSGGFSEGPPHSFLETVSPRSGYHLVLSENNVRINAQLQPVACLAVLVEENLVSRNTRRLEGVMANLDILSGHKMDLSGSGIHECTSNGCKPDLRESDSFCLSSEMPLKPTVLPANIL